MKRQIMGREVVLAITYGRLDFGTWEQISMVDLMAHGGSAGWSRSPEGEPAARDLETVRIVPEGAANE